MGKYASIKKVYGKRQAHLQKMRFSFKSPRNKSMRAVASNLAKLARKRSWR